VITRLPYFPEYAVPVIARFRTIILAGAPSPVSFFGYPGTPSHYIAPQQQTVELAGPEEDVETALEELAAALGAPPRAATAASQSPAAPAILNNSLTGHLTGQTMTAVVAALLPPGAIVMDEGHTSTGAHTAYFQAAAPHSYLTQPGGAIGLGMPCAIGAAIACPDRPVVTLQADGSGMYTVQSLWTMAREGLNIKTIICNNSGYRIVGIEMQRAGVTRVGDRARSLMEMEAPQIDWVGVSRGLGVPAARVVTPGELAEVLRRELAAPGPFLIDAVLEAE
ncbi:MAG: Thiamine pyrophosphate-dependent enzyme possible carboligase or decarboxylase, partial [Acidobacteriota bacterium]